MPALTQIETNQWECIFKLSHICATEVKIKNFQYKILHQIVNCRSKLNEWRIVTDSICKFCNHIDDLPHFLVKCDKSYKFWNQLIAWWNKNNMLQVDIERNDIVENIIFGFMDMNEEHMTVNFVFLYAKYFIYTMKQNDNCQIDFYKFLPYLSYAIYRELKIINKSAKKISQLSKLERLYNIY